MTEHRKEIMRLQWFLQQIAGAEGPFKIDPAEHYQAVIEESVNLARAALRDPTAGNEDVEWDGRSFKDSADD